MHTYQQSIFDTSCKWKIFTKQYKSIDPDDLEVLGNIIAAKASEDRQVPTQQHQTSVCLLNLLLNKVRNDEERKITTQMI